MGYLRPQIGVFSYLDLIFTFLKKKSGAGRRASTKNEPKTGRFFFGQSFPGLYMRQCTHKHLQTSHETQLEGPGIFIILGGSYFYLPSTCREISVGLAQNGQILFISVEQLSLNVADDSAKTLSVLGNMGDLLDDCRLRFLQMCRRPPQKYPRFWGPTDFFKILPKKDPYRNHTKSMN